MTRELSFEDYSEESVDSDIESLGDGKKEFLVLAGETVVDEDGNEEESLEIEIAFTRDELEGLLKKFVEVRGQISTRAQLSSEEDEESAVEPAQQHQPMAQGSQPVQQSPQPQSPQPTSQPSVQQSQGGIHQPGM